MKFPNFLTTGFLFYVAITQGAQAVIFTWDPDSVATGNQGSGNWNTTDPEWYVTAGTYVGWTNSTANTALFNATISGGAQTATVTENITVGNISSQQGANVITLNPATTLSLGANGTNSNSISVSNNSFQINGTGTILFTTSSTWNPVGGALTIASGVTVDLGANILTFAGTNSHALNGIVTGTGGGLAKINAGALALSNTNTYTGATTIGTAGSATSAGVVTVNGVAGSIATSSGYTISGTGSQLNLDYTGGAGPATLDRLNDSSGAALTLNNGAEARFTNATNATNTSETFGTLTLNTGAGIVSVNQAGTGGAVNTITASAFSRGSNFGTGLIRASSLGVTTNTNRGQVKLTSTAGLTQIGSSTSATGLGSGIVKDLTIVPYLIGDTSTGDTGDNFVTYDTTSGFRILGASEQVLLATGTYSPAGNPENVKLSTSTVTLGNVSGITVNSLALLGGTNTLNSTNAIALTVNSGAVGQFVSGVTGTIGSGFSQLNLDNNEGVVTVLGSGILDIATPIDVTSGGTHAAAGALTKAGAGTLRLSAGNLFTGVTTVNAGTLQIGSGTSGDLGSNSANIILNGGTLSFGRTNAGLTLVNTISGGGAVLQNGPGGTTVLTGPNTYTGGTTITAGTLTVSGAGSLADTGAVTVNGGTYDVAVNDTVGAVTLSSGTISGAGILSSTSYAVTNTGSANATLAGTATLTKTGAGTFTLFAPNTFSGATTVSAGVLNIQNSTALGTTAGGTTVANLAALQIQNGITVGAEALTLNGTGISNDGALRNISDTNIYGGVVTLGSNTRINSDAGSLTLSGGIVGATRNLTVGGAGNTSISTIATTTGTLTKDGTGTLSISGASTYTGVTNVNDGKLIINGSLSNSNVALNVVSGATLGGTGTVGRNVAIADGGKLEFDLVTDAASHNKLDISAGRNFDFAGASVLTITSSGGTPAPGLYTLVDGGNNITGTAPTTVNLPLGWTADPPVITTNKLQINITSTSGGDVTPPTLTSIVDDKTGGPVTVNTLVTYTVTFNEDMDAASVTAADFDNDGSAAVTIGTVIEGSPGVFTVQVTPTSTGSLKLRIKAGAVLEDTSSNDLAVPVSDDTTITVQTSYDAWSGGAAFEADTNGDGVKNGVAFLLGATNPNVSALDKLPVVSESGGNLVLTFSMLNAATRGGAVLNVEHSSDLGISDPWTVVAVPDANAGPTNGVTFAVTAGSPTNSVTATISSSEAAGGKLFGRLSAEPTP